MMIRFRFIKLLHRNSLKKGKIQTLNQTKIGILVLQNFPLLFCLIQILVMEQEQMVVRLPIGC